MASRLDMIRAVDCSAITPKSDGVPCTPRRAATGRLRRPARRPDRQGDLPLTPTGVSIRILSTTLVASYLGMMAITAPCLATIFPRQGSSDVTMFSILRTATCTRSTRARSPHRALEERFARGGAFGARGARSAPPGDVGLSSDRIGKEMRHGASLAPVRKPRRT